MGIADVPSRTHEEPEGLYEMIIAITNKLKNINKRSDKNHEELRTFRKEYGECEERKRSDMRLLAQQVTKLERDLPDAQKNAKISGHDPPNKPSLKFINAMRLFSGK